MKTLVALLAAMGLAASATVALAQEDCDEGMTWDETTESCVPDES